MFGQFQESKKNFALTPDEQKKIADYREQINKLNSQKAELKSEAMEDKQYLLSWPTLEGNIRQLEGQIEEIKKHFHHFLTEKLHNKKIHGHCLVDKENGKIIFNVYEYNEWELNDYFSASKLPFQVKIKHDFHHDQYHAVTFDAKYFIKLIAWLGKAPEFQKMSYPYYLAKQFVLGLYVGIDDAENEEKSATPMNFQLSKEDQEKIKQLESEVQAAKEELAKYNQVQVQLSQWVKLNEEKKRLEEIIEKLTHPVDKETSDLLKEKFPQLYTTAHINRETQQMEIGFYGCNLFEEVKKILEPLCQNKATFKHKQYGDQISSDFIIVMDTSIRQVLLKGMKDIPVEETWLFEPGPSRGCNH